MNCAQVFNKLIVGYQIEGEVRAAQRSRPIGGSGLDDIYIFALSGKMQAESHLLTSIWYIVNMIIR